VQRPGKRNPSREADHGIKEDKLNEFLGRFITDLGATAAAGNGGYSLGGQAGEAAIRQIATEAGFTRFRRGSQTPFNLVYEVRP
jgi:hypothetical protein